MDLCISILIIVFDVAQGEYSVLTVFFSCIQLSDLIYPTFWCMKSILVGSIFSYVNGNKRISVPIIILEVIFLYKVGCVIVTLVLSYPLCKFIDYIALKISNILIKGIEEIKVYTV